MTAPSDGEPAKPAEMPNRRHLTGALEAAVAALRARAEAAEKRADASEAERQAAQARADHAAAERDEANRQAEALKRLLDATRLELAGLRALIEVAPHSAETLHAESSRKARGRWARLRAAWRGE